MSHLDQTNYPLRTISNTLALILGAIGVALVVLESYYTAEWIGTATTATAAATGILGGWIALLRGEKHVWPDLKVQGILTSQPEAVAALDTDPTPELADDLDPDAAPIDLADLEDTALPDLRED